MPFDIEFIRNTLEAEGIHIENDGPLDSFYSFAVAIREQTIKELQGGPDGATHTIRCYASYPTKLTRILKSQMRIRRMSQSLTGILKRVY